MIYKTSEWVSLGHSDKMADYISEYILDRLIEKDPETRYGLEVQIKNHQVCLAGEITTNAEYTNYDLHEFASEAIKEIGYTHKYQEKFGKVNTIAGEDVSVVDVIFHQSPDIAKGVDDNGWGDQGIFFGYYCNETPEGQGYEYQLAKDIGKKIYEKALSPNSVLGLDIKTQVTISLEANRDPERIVEEIIIAVPMVQGKEKEGKKEIKEILKLFPDTYHTSVIINGTGKYTRHGPVADAGTTGRKLVVDFYGGRSRIGGGCVDSDTEYLSDNGWKKISEYDGGKVGQLTDNLELEMVKPEQYIDTYHDEIYEISTEKTTNMVLSENHNVLYRTSKGNLQKKSLKQILEKSSKTKKGSHIDIPMTFTYNFANGKVCKYLEDWARIVVAHCADGSVIKKGSKKWNCRIRVKKQYKIDRLRMLFSKYPDLYEERKYSDGYSYFYYYLEDTSKLLSEQFSKPDNKTAKILSEEVLKWYGSEKYKEYRTTKKEDADFIQFILSGITGKAHSICIHKKNNGHKECYVVRETKKTYSNPFRKIGKNKIEKKEPQKMYCFTVPSGMLLLRRNNYIFCTGNSPWTKDGTKADLSLNLLAFDLAKDYFNELKEMEAPVHHTEVELSCCIGRKEVLMQLIAYDEEGNPFHRMNDLKTIKHSELIKRYHLDKPIYAQLCREGLFSLINSKDKIKEKKQ